MVRRGRAWRERDLRPRAPADIARRRGHGSPVLLPRARGLPGRRSHRQIRVHAGAHGLPASVPAEVLAAGGGGRCAADPPPHPPRDAGSPLARQPAGDRLGRRRAGRDRHGLLRSVHGLPSQGPGARALDLDRPWRAGGGGLRHRDQRARRTGRQTGPVRRCIRGCLRLHLPPGRHGRGGATGAAGPHPAVSARPAAPLLHGRDAFGVGHPAPSRIGAPGSTTR
jgi:hypothetical protein